jgi:hypothetical protein
MSEEIFDTRGNNWGPLKEGDYDYRIEEPFSKGDKGFVKLKLSYEDTNGPDSGEISLFPNEMGDLFELLGWKRVEAKKYKGDPALAIGKYFKATCIKEPSKTDMSKSYMKLRNFRKSDKTDDIDF